MNNVEIVQKAAKLLESRDLGELDVLLADDFRAKGSTMELIKQLSWLVQSAERGC